MENRNKLRGFPRSPSFFINNSLPSMVCVILFSQILSFLRQCQSSYMMKFKDLIAAERSLFGCYRSTLGFVVLPFVGVALFPSPASCGSYVVP